MAIKKDHNDCWNNQYDQILKQYMYNISLKIILPYIDLKINSFSCNEKCMCKGDD